MGWGRDGEEGREEIAAAAAKIKERIRKCTKTATTNLLQKCTTEVNPYSVTANRGRRHTAVSLWLPARTGFCHIRSVCIPSSFWKGNHTTIQTTCIIGQAKLDSAQLIQNLSIIRKTLRPATWITSIILCIKLITTTFILSSLTHITNA